jgi:hypothetical protein
MTSTHEFVHPRLLTLYFLFRSSIFLLFYMLMISILIMQTWNFASRRRLMLQLPLDLLDLRYLLDITPYALCFSFIIFIIPYAQQLVS